jgi:hypothetical protein
VALERGPVPSRLPASVQGLPSVPSPTYLWTGRESRIRRSESRIPGCVSGYGPFRSGLAAVPSGRVIPTFLFESPSSLCSELLRVPPAKAQRALTSSVLPGAFHFGSMDARCGHLSACAFRLQQPLSNELRLPTPFRTSAMSLKLHVHASAPCGASALS